MYYFFFLNDRWGIGGTASYTLLPIRFWWELLGKTRGTNLGGYLEGGVMGTLSTRPHFWASSVPWGVTRAAGTQTLGGRTGGVMGIPSSPCPFMLDPATAPSCWAGASIFPRSSTIAVWGSIRSNLPFERVGFGRYMCIIIHTCISVCLLVGKPERNSGGTQFVFVRHHSVKRRRLQLVKVLLLWEGTLLFFWEEYWNFYYLIGKLNFFFLWQT